MATLPANRFATLPRGFTEAKTGILLSLHHQLADLVRDLREGPLGGAGGNIKLAVLADGYEGLAK